MSVIKLRPHHVLCISFFEGKGYSEEFVSHMTALIQALNDNTEIQLVNGTDQICKVCPNHNNLGGCSGKATRYDQMVSKLCNLEANCSITWHELQSKVKSEITKTGRLAEICGDCEWSNLCLSKSL